MADTGVRFDKSTGADGDRVVVAMQRWFAALRIGNAEDTSTNLLRRRLGSVSFHLLLRQRRGQLHHMRL
jgi:hypothetical protein